MKQNNTALREILKHLADGTEKSLYSLHEKYRLSPVEIIEAVNLLKEEDIINHTGKVISVENRFDLNVIGKARKHFYSQPPELLLCTESPTVRLGVNEPYLPDRDLLDHSYFKIKK